MGDAVWIGEAVPDMGDAVELATYPGAVDSVTGHTVVYRDMTSVVTWPILAGQLVTVAAQLVMV